MNILDCADVFKTVGLGVTTLSEGVANEIELDIIKDDPLIMWHFDVIKKETVV